MSVLERCYPGDAAVQTAVLVAVQITGVALVAWLLARVAGRRRAAWRSAVWLGALVAVLASPVASVALRSARVSLVSVSLPAAPPAPVAPMPISDAPDGDGVTSAPAPGEATERFSAVKPSAIRGPSRPSRSAVPVWIDSRVLGGGVFVLWSAGCAFYFVRLMLGCRWVLGLYQDATPLEESRHAATLAKVRRTLGVVRLPTITVSRRVRAPLAVGGVRPARVILPEGFAATLDSRALHDVLVHECAHVLQRDPYVGLLQRLAEMLFWPHLLVHWLNRQLVAAREELCDNYVLRGSEATHYSRTLLRLCELAPAPPPLAAAGLLRPLDNLPARVAGLLDEGRNTMTRVATWKTALVSAAILVPVVSVPGTRLLPAEPQTAEPQAATPPPAVADPPSARPTTQQHDEESERLAIAMRGWETEVRELIKKDERLKGLAAKYPLVVLHSRSLFPEVDYNRSAFSFVHESSDPKAHGNNVQLLFHNGGTPKTFDISMQVGQQNLVVDLGFADLEEDPDVSSISIDDPRVLTGNPTAVEGHVYLECVRDSLGNDFRVLFQVVAVSPTSDYVAFLWRRLRGGTLVKEAKPRARDEELAKLVRERVQRPQEEKLEELAQVARQWLEEVRRRLEADAALKALAERHPLVLLHSRCMYAQGDYVESAYSFIYETADEELHLNDVQLLFHNGGDPYSFDVNMVTNQENLVVDLGRADFEENPIPGKITIDHPGLLTGGGTAVEGKVYLERVRDSHGNNFYVLFRIVAVDAESRYMAFLWRRLPGGVVVKRPPAPVPAVVF